MDNAKRIAAAGVIAAEMPREKMPLQRETPPAVPFPHDALMGLEPAVTAIQNMTQGPLAMCANSVLAAAGLAVQGHADVQLPVAGGLISPICEFFITVAASGERKSASDKLALKPISDRELALRQEYDVLRQRYIDDRDVWEKTRKKTINGKDDLQKKQDELAALGQEPKEPIRPLLTMPEPTYSGLHKYLERGQPSIGIFSAEGGQFIGGHGMREENKMETAAGFNALWDGSPLKRVRSGDGTSFYDGKRVSLHLMAQPDTALKFIADPQLEDQGTLARCLICFPASTQGSRKWKEADPKDTAALDSFYARMEQILSTRPRMRDGSDNELDPRVLVLSAAARDLWIEFDCSLEKERGPAGYFSRIAGLANKLPEHAVRLAAILALYDGIACQEIGADYMRAGIKLAQYYASEALRLKDIQAEDKTLAVAARLLEWLRDKKYQNVPLQDIYQKAPITEIRNAKRSRQVMKLLEEHGHVEMLPAGAEIEGIHRREVWRLT